MTSFGCADENQELEYSLQHIGDHFVGVGAGDGGEREEWFS